MGAVLVPEGRFHPCNAVQRMGFRDFVIQHQTAVREIIGSRVRTEREPYPAPEPYEAQSGEQEDGRQNIHNAKSPGRNGQAGLVFRSGS